MLCYCVLWYLCVSRTPTQDTLSLIYIRTCWPKLSSPRKPRKGSHYHVILLCTAHFVFKWCLFLSPVVVSVFPFMRRQRHSSPSPAQAAAPATDEDGRVKQASQAGTDSAAGSQVWRQRKDTCQSPPSPSSLLVSMATTQEVHCFESKLSFRSVYIFLLNYKHSILLPETYSTHVMLVCTSTSTFSSSPSSLCEI